VAPAPVILLIVLFELGEIAMAAMLLFCPHTIGLIFMIIPFMIVIVLLVVVGACGLVLLGLQRYGRHCDWGNEGGAQQDRIQKMGTDYSHSGDRALVMPAIDASQLAPVTPCTLR